MAILDFRVSSTLCFRPIYTHFQHSFQACNLKIFSETGFYFKRKKQLFLTRSSVFAVNFIKSVHHILVYQDYLCKLYKCHSFITLFIFLGLKLKFQRTKALKQEFTGDVQNSSRGKSHTFGKT